MRRQGGIHMLLLPLLLRCVTCKFTPQDSSPPAHLVHGTLLGGREAPLRPPAVLHMLLQHMAGRHGR